MLTKADTSGCFLCARVGKIKMRDEKGAWAVVKCPECGGSGKNVKRTN